MKKQMRVIGLMSGSSLDGIDLAYCLFAEKNGKWTYKIEAAHCYEFDDEMKNRLANAATLSGRELMKLNADLGMYFGNKISAFMRDFLTGKKVDLIASHGHTVFHFPDEHFTTQIGDASHIAAITKVAVAADLRAKDVALGGNGAPVVPIGEKYLFGDYQLFLNIGGIANISVHRNDKIIAFDVCAANQVLNYLANQVGKPFDEDGKIAEKGNINALLADELNAISFYQKSYPKSLDNSFGKQFVLPVLERFEISVEDKLATYCEHIAIQLKNALKNAVDTSENAATMPLFITGGGAFNRFLIAKIAEICEVKIEIPDPQTVAFKEALIIAFMGVLRIRGEVNILKSVTGASRDSVNGGLF